MERPKITLTDLSGDLPEPQYVFEEPAWCVLGRAQDCDIQFPASRGHANVSRHHCLLVVEPPRIRVHDLGSHNGTYVNGEKIGQHPERLAPQERERVEKMDHYLHDGDELQIGDARLLVEVADTSETPEPVWQAAHALPPW